MKRRNFLKTLLAVAPVVYGCKAVTMPTDKLLPTVTTGLAQTEFPNAAISPVTITMAGDKATYNYAKTPWKVWYTSRGETNEETNV